MAAKSLLGANSPSLYPTKFSLTNTGMNFFQLRTARVTPREGVALNHAAAREGRGAAWCFSAFSLPCTNRNQRVQKS